MYQPIYLAFKTLLAFHILVSCLGHDVNKGMAYILFKKIILGEGDLLNFFPSNTNGYRMQNLLLQEDHIPT